MVMTTETISTLQAEEIEEVASGLHGEIAVAMSSYLFNYVRPKKLGRVFDGRTTFELAPNSPKREPDVSFVTLERLPANIDDFIPFAPDLAVEVISGNDDWKAIVAKVDAYLQAGVRLVWVIDPYTHAVFVFRPTTGLVFQTMRDEEELDGEDVIPGFKLKVKALFE
jgi:Uma2 family endonuclease